MEETKFAFLAEFDGASGSDRKFSPFAWPSILLGLVHADPNKKVHVKDHALITIAIYQRKLAP